MNKFIIRLLEVILIAFVLATAATCEPTEHKVGHYIISVDAGRDINWTALEPIVLEGIGYNITSFPLNGMAEDAPSGENHVTITIVESDPATAKILSTSENLTKAVKNGMALAGWEPISISPKTFDNRQGMIGVAYWEALRETIFLGQWLMNDTYITLNSNIQWGEGTKQIFDTIHIEKSKVK
jgi:hypothetical protein